MSIKSRLVGGALALAVVTTLGISVQTAAMAQAPDAHPAAFHHGMRPGMDEAALQPLRAALRQLDLTDAQKQSARSILEGARSQATSARQSAPADLVALGNPADPNHAAAVADAKARADARIQQMSEVQQQLYALLTPAQQAKLPALLADLQQKREARTGS
jgi:protein CpxP